MLFCACEKDSPNSSPCIPDDLMGDVLAFYPFTNGSINDFSSNGRDLTNNTAASGTIDRAGNSNCAFEFNNLPDPSEFLTRTDADFMNNLEAFSISLWYQPLNDARDGGMFEGLINRDLGFQCPDRNGQWSIGLYDCRKAVFGAENSVWDLDMTNFDCGQEILDRTNTWAHLVVTYSKDEVAMAIYRNGEVQESILGSAQCFSTTPDVAEIGALFLGRDYTGKLDDLIIFDKVLTQSEIDALFSFETCCQ